MGAVFENARHAPYTSRIVKPHQLSAADIACWDSFCQSDPRLQTAFLSFGFAQVAAEVFGGVRICVIEQLNEPVAYFPFRVHGALNTLIGHGERVGGELSDSFGVAARHDLRVAPSELLDLAHLHGLFFTHLQSEQESFGLTGVQPEIGLRIELSDGSEAYWQARRREAKQFVTDTERCWRRLRESYGRYEFHFNHANPLSHIEEIIERKRSQYRRTGVADPLNTDRSQMFLRMLSQLKSPSCQGVTSTLHAGTAYAASHFGLMCYDTLHYWWPVYDPALANLSPGRLLMHAMINDSKTQGFSRIDLGAGDTPAKRGFANASVTYQRGAWLRRSLRGAIISAALSLRWRLQSARSS